MSHIWMSHVSCMTETWCTWEWVMSSTWFYTYKWVISHVWIRHAIFMNESCHTCVSAMSHNESRHVLYRPFKCVTWLITWVIRVLDTTHPYWWRDSCSRTLQAIWTCDMTQDMTHSCVWRDSSILMAWRMTAHCAGYFKVWHESWHASFVRLTWNVSFVRLTWLTCLMTWLIRLLHTTHPYLWYYLRLRTWARGKRRGFSPGAAARHSQHARVHTKVFLNTKIHLQKIFCS